MIKKKEDFSNSKIELIEIFSRHLIGKIKLYRPQTDTHIIYYLIWSLLLRDSHEFPYKKLYTHIKFITVNISLFRVHVAFYAR